MCERACGDGDVDSGGRVMPLSDGFPILAADCSPVLSSSGGSGSGVGCADGSARALLVPGAGSHNPAEESSSPSLSVVAGRAEEELRGCAYDTAAGVASGGCG